MQACIDFQMRRGTRRTCSPGLLQIQWIGKNLNCWSKITWVFCFVWLFLPYICTGKNVKMFCFWRPIFSLAHSQWSVHHWSLFFCKRCVWRYALIKKRIQLSPSSLGGNPLLGYGRKTRAFQTLSNRLAPLSREEGHNGLLSHARGRSLGLFLLILLVSLKQWERERCLPAFSFSKNVLGISISCVVMKNPFPILIPKTFLENENAVLIVITNIYFQDCWPRIKTSGSKLSSWRSTLL